MLVQGTREAISQLKDSGSMLVLDGTTDLAVARGVAERLERELSKPYKIGAKEIRIGASIGASVRQHETETAEAVLGRADAAMYRAKAGRRPE